MTEEPLGGRQLARKPVRTRQAGLIGLYLAGGYLLLVGSVALLAPLIAPHDASAQDLANRFAAPSLEHLLGTDEYGRDVASRLMFAARLALAAPAIAVGVASLAAIPLGLLAGFRGGWVDLLLGKAADVLLSVPAIVLAIAVIAVLGPSLPTAMLAVGIVYAPRLFRLVRASTIAVREETYVHVARSIGCKDSWILARHVLPNIAGPLLVETSLLMGLASLAEASLSFLGLGVQPPDASWGSMLRSAYENRYNSPNAAIAPGVALALTVLAFNTIGDVTRDIVTGRGRHSS